ncbi:MAG: diguanylate cyclase domain-containing protein [Burkholderiaceae bacterium]
MRLSKFIFDNLETILQEWEDFAATLIPDGQTADKIVLRDHAKKMLVAIALDLAEPETECEEIKKSTGQSDSPTLKRTAATSHGIERRQLGFSLDAAMAEYRALRASVTRLWQKSLVGKPLPETATADMIRFNEAIDQSINESVTSYSHEKEQQMRVFDTILSSLPDISFIFMLDRKLSYVNKAMMELFAPSVENLIGKNFVEIGMPNGAELQRQIEQVINTKMQVRGEMSYTDPSGKNGFYDYIFVPAFDTTGKVEAVACTARNITERKAKEDQNWHKANYDLLTGLPNRRLFLDRLDQDIKHAERIGACTALLFIDLDHFKEANDQFGHDTGDVLLRLVTDRLRSCIRETDTAARLGGDEFTVILQDLCDTRYVELVAGKILKELANPFRIFDNTIHISASIGITLSPQDASSPDQLIKNADQAMYMAKNAGRNQFSFFAPGQQQAVGASLQYESKRTQPNGYSRNYRN